MTSHSLASPAAPLLRIRFEIVCEPSDSWAVWDNHTDLPASFRSRILFGLTRSEAQGFAAMLNDACAPRSAV